MKNRRIGIAALLLAAAVAATPAAATQKGAQTCTEGDRVQIAQDFLRAIERGDTDTLRRFLTADYIQVEQPNVANPKGQTRGLDKTIEGARKGVEILEWQRYDFKNIVAAGDWVVIESGWKAKLKGRGWGKLPEGYVFDAMIAVFMHFEGCKIRMSRNYDTYQPFPS